jgi:hypothetical protein
VVDPVDGKPGGYEGGAAVTVAGTVAVARCVARGVAVWRTVPVSRAVAGRALAVSVLGAAGRSTARLTLQALGRGFGLLRNRRPSS